MDRIGRVDHRGGTAGTRRVPAGCQVGHPADCCRRHRGLPRHQHAELAIGVQSALQDDGTLALGNIAGTNTVNLLLILGLSALIRPLAMKTQTLPQDGTFDGADRGTRDRA